MHAQDPSAGARLRILLGDDLHEPVGLTDDQRATVADVPMLRREHIEPGFLGGLL